MEYNHKMSGALQGPRGQIIMLFEIFPEVWSSKLKFPKSMAPSMPKLGGVAGSINF